MSGEGDVVAVVYRGPTLADVTGNRKFVDSPLEGAGFELPVPRAMQRGFPCTPRQTAGFSIQEDEIPPETDCLQDGNGFELQVPRCTLITNSTPWSRLTRCGSR